MYYDPSEEYKEKLYVQSPINCWCKRIDNDNWEIISPRGYKETISDELFRERFECSLEENKKFILIPEEINEGIKTIVNYFANIPREIQYK
jgi:hypothetical protein